MKSRFVVFALGVAITAIVSIGLSVAQETSPVPLNLNTTAEEAAGVEPAAPAEAAETADQPELRVQPKQTESDPAIVSEIPAADSQPYFPNVPASAGGGTKTDQDWFPKEQKRETEAASKIKLFTFEKSNAVEVAQWLTALQFGSDITFIPDPKTNSLTVRSADPELMTIIEKLILRYDSLRLKSDDNPVKKESDAPRGFSFKRDRSVPVPATKDTGGVGFISDKELNARIEAAAQVLQKRKASAEPILHPSEAGPSVAKFKGDGIHSESQSAGESSGKDAPSAKKSRHLGGFRIGGPVVDDDDKTPSAKFTSHDRQEMQSLIRQLNTFDEKAAKIAEQIRSDRTEKENDNSPQNDPKQIQLKADLTGVLSQALPIKFRLESLQIQQIEARLEELKHQNVVRRQSANQIVQRRSQQLIEGSATEWTPSELKLSNGVNSTPEQARGIPRNVSENIKALKAHRPGFCTEDGPPDLNAKLDAIVSAAGRNDVQDFNDAIDNALECVNVYKLQNEGRQKHPKADVLTLLVALKSGYSDIRNIPFYKFVTKTGERRMGLPNLNYSEAEPDAHQGGVVGGGTGGGFF